ncbi:MAG TPA: arylsulfatase [Chitinophagaceae bacterium]|nr:arylsulfatase [Chitinophagaceae bacterium]
MRRMFWLASMFVFVSLQAQQNKPNVIYIYADDLGYGELGCYGQEKIKTPNLDKLAADGMKFTQHYTGAPVCAPARAMLMTGKHSGHAYIRGNYELGMHEDSLEGGQMPLPEGTLTVARLMKQAGYVTGAIGKWGLGMWYSTGDPNKQGFDYFYGYLDQKQAHNLYPTHLWENGKWDSLRNRPFTGHARIPENSPDSVFESFRGKDYALTRMGDKTIEFLKKNKDKPFFLYLPYTSPHLALQVPSEALNEYIGKFPEKPYYGDKGYTPVRYPLSTYAAMITYLDRQVGRVMDMLKELGLEKNTIVMFSSDNGPTFNVGGVDASFFNSTAGLRGLKQDLYEGGIREPFIVRWPGKIKPGSVSDHISAQFDLLSTLADITNQKLPRTDGISFLPALTGQKQKTHEYLYFEFPEKSGQVAIRMGKWKGIKSNMKANRNSPWEIFDLENDPGETKNLAGSQLDLAKQFDEIARKEHNCPHIREWEFVDPKIARAK